MYNVSAGAVWARQADGIGQQNNAGLNEVTFTLTNNFPSLCIYDNRGGKKIITVTANVQTKDGHVFM